MYVVRLCIKNTRTRACGSVDAIVLATFSVVFALSGRRRFALKPNTFGARAHKNNSRNPRHSDVGDARAFERKRENKKKENRNKNRLWITVVIAAVICLGRPFMEAARWLFNLLTCLSWLLRLSGARYPGRYAP